MKVVMKMKKLNATPSPETTIGSNSTTTKGSFEVSLSSNDENVKALRYKSKSLSNIDSAQYSSGEIRRIKERLLR